MALLILLWSRDEAAMAGGRREAQAMAFDGTGEGVSLHGGGGVELDGKRHSGEVREARGELLASGTRAGSGARAARRGRPPPLLKVEAGPGVGGAQEEDDGEE